MDRSERDKNLQKIENRLKDLNKVLEKMRKNEKKLDKDQFEAFLLKNKNKIYKQINKSKKDIQKKFCSESKLNDHLFFDICIKKKYTNDKEFWGKFEQMKLKFEKDYKLIIDRLYL